MLDRKKYITNFKPRDNKKSDNLIKRTMVGFSENRTKSYEGMNLRRKIMRFLDDNRDMFMDYPKNTEYLIERGDLSSYEYYTTTLQDQCFYSSLALSTIGLFGILYKFRASRFRVIVIPLCILPVPCAAFYHYYKLGQFLDYCEVKYKNRGLYDEELWEFHKNNSARRINS